MVKNILHFVAIGLVCFVLGGATGGFVGVAWCTKNQAEGQLAVVEKEQKGVKRHHVRSQRLAKTYQELETRIRAAKDACLDRVVDPALRSDSVHTAPRQRTPSGVD